MTWPTPAIECSFWQEHEQAEDITREVKDMGHISEIESLRK